MILSVLTHLLDETANHLERYAGFQPKGERKALIEAFARDFRAATLSEDNVQIRQSGAVMGLRHAPIVLAGFRDQSCASLYDAAAAAFGLVHWNSFYGPDAWSKNFLDDFATGTGIGPKGRVRHESIILGLFVLGPHTFYPSHAHPAEEFYIGLSGEAVFMVGHDEEGSTIASGDISVHETDVAHAIYTSEQPFFAVFGWRGSLNEPSWYKQNMDDVNEPKHYPPLS